MTVREVAGRTAPTSPTAGAVVYTGTGTSYRASKLAGHKDYMFCVTTVSPTLPVSAPRCVTALGTSVTATTRASSVWKRPKTRVAARLSTALGGVAGRVLSLQRRSGGSWRTLAHQTTRKGTAAFSLRPAATATYRVVFTGAGHDLGSLAPAFRVAVRH